MKKIKVATDIKELKNPSYMGRELFIPPFHNFTMKAGSLASKSSGSTINKANFPFSLPIPNRKNLISIQTYLILSLTYLILTHKGLFLLYNSKDRAYDRDVILENLK